MIPVSSKTKRLFDHSLNLHFATLRSQHVFHLPHTRAEKRLIAHQLTPESKTE